MVMYANINHKRNYVVMCVVVAHWSRVFDDVCLYGSSENVIW